jgi:transcription elongation factor GreA
MFYFLFYLSHSPKIRTVAIFFKPCYNENTRGIMADEGFVYLTKERLVELEKELQDLKMNGRKEIAAKIAEARAHGDLSENAEYDAAKEEQGLFELKISKMESMLSRVRIIEPSQFQNGQIHILSKVQIKNLKTGKVFNYTLVSPEEADFQAGKISVTSPVGQGLMGAKKNEKIKVQAPAGLLEFEILDVQ